MGILSEAEWMAVALSLKVAFWATLLSLPVGIAVALALARGNFPGKQLLNGLVHLPLILPPPRSQFGSPVLLLPPSLSSEPAAAICRCRCRRQLTLSPTTFSATSTQHSVG